MNTIKEIHLNPIETDVHPALLRKAKNGSCDDTNTYLEVEGAECKQGHFANPTPAEEADVHPAMFRDAVNQSK